MTLVIDCTVVIESLLGNHDADSELAAHMSQDLHAPELLDYEVVAVLRRLNVEGKLSDDRAREAFLDFCDLHITRHPVPAFTPAIWELRHDFIVADAAYVALADALHVPLLTMDANLAGNHKATVQVHPPAN